ncbi:tripartite motif-containing protein 43-like [Dromiciops gliroides]|uniref:tripartite motif-containing protein 43-like n=1 Tax=Dromiciops gliroides TaxID=33562 RepID=UPI001CC5CF5B|nr:tripartite motif-containing protein 43-like [Dromiciops gliroides]
MFLDEIEEEEESLCAICWNWVSKTIIVDCGHPACLSCLSRKTFLPFCCTMCWEFSRLRTLQAAIAMHPDGEGGVCEMHREDQKLFCESDKMLLCVTCSESEDHEDHIHWPIAVAALGYRKMIRKDMKFLNYHVKIVQELQIQEKDRPMVWALVWTDHKVISRKIFKEKIQVIWEYLKKEKTETTDVEELIMGTGNEKFIKLYQRLKEMEAEQEQDIMDQKKEWEDMMSRQSIILIDKIRELEEKSQKSNVELLQVRDTFERNYIGTNLEPFIPHVDTFYLNVATEFLKFFHASGLSQTCNSYNFSKEKKSTVTFVPDSSGKKYAIYTTGNLQVDSIRITAFLLRTSSQDRVLEEVHTRKITSFWASTFEG